MLSRLLFSLCLVTPTLAVKPSDGCYAHPSGCGCTTNEKTCKADGNSWLKASNYCDCDIKSTDDTDTAGCQVDYGSHGKQWDTKKNEQSCTGKAMGSYQRTWKRTGCEACNVNVPPSPPAPPPAPPSPPPAPPQACVISGLNAGSNYPKTTADSPDPINEPCYSHASCRKYGDPDKLAGGVCCMPRGKCDHIHDNTHPYLSGSANYYMGGCRGVRYNKQTLGNVSKSTAHPTTDDGCYKQGECMLAYIEQSRYKLSGGGGLERLDLPDATMDIMLKGAIEAYDGACRELYPYKDKITPVAQVQMQMVVQGTLSDFNDAKLTKIGKTVAARVGVAPSRVKIVAAAGSVVLGITISYPSKAAAATATTSLAAKMATPAAAAAFLSTPSDPIVVDSVAAAPAASDHGVALVLVSLKASSSDSLSGGAIAGITIGAVVGALLVLLLIVLLVKKMNKKNATAMKNTSADSQTAV